MKSKEAGETPAMDLETIIHVPLTVLVMILASYVELINDCTVGVSSNACFFGML